GQNELDINECDAQIPHIVKNLRSPNEVRGNNRLTAVIEDTLIINITFYYSIFNACCQYTISIFIILQEVNLRFAYMQGNSNRIK
ncbi:MAG: hypothetical protein J6A30_07330, partial [Ruminococcus sp.]|nr:hypothetical protein [Ruminococcus sp.]